MEPTYRDRLRRISAAAQSLQPPACAALRKAGIDTHPSSTRTTDHQLPSPRLHLPIPDDISASLTNLGCSPSKARALSDAFIRSARQTQSDYEATHHQSCKDMAQRHPSSHLDSLELRLENLGSVLERHYHGQIEASKRLIIDRVRSLQQQPHPARTSKKQMFNAVRSPNIHEQRRRLTRDAGICSLFRDVLQVQRLSVSPRSGSAGKEIDDDA